MCIRPTSRLRTLLVDGSEAFRTGLAGWIAPRSDMDLVGSVQTGAEAIALTRVLRPDLVVLDGVLPGLDGFRVARILKSSPRAPLVVVTAFLASDAARHAALLSGADGFVAMDNFATEFERLLPELLELRQASEPGVRRPARSDRPGSRSEPAP